MITSYQVFILVVIALWVWSTPRDRNALSIILVASLVSTLAVTFFTREITASWKLAIPATVETITVIAMVKYGNSRTAYIQAGLLVVAWLSHVICYFDILLGTDFVYSRYETILQLVALAQILACHDTIRHLLTRLHRMAANLLASGVVGVRAAGAFAGLLSDTRPPRV